ncbi:hypothetical protein GTQ34_05225 [Muricauda sp. JGD-17]|uniref:Uncharacterized protein n=1 Tax=Flagellimonas ochracea TaxID=2696472 RepID=A0A964WX79_9FLAO|nr:hypothetical protein [Allomuricauda ochracea]NAY91314.1 hypothetical protein [Allomuricauda ochracea]
MILITLLLVILLLIVGLLLIPFEIYINTNSNQYYAQLRGLAKASIEQDKEEVLRIRLKVPFKNFFFYPLRKSSVSQQKKTVKKKVKKKRRKIGPRRILSVLKSFKIKKMLVDIDTGNCITNAKLYPVFALLNHYFGRFQINFEGRNQMVLLLQNRPIYIIRSFINY